jgi:hypothetical protein
MESDLELGGRRIVGKKEIHSEVWLLDNPHKK